MPSEAASQIPGSGFGLTRKHRYKRHFLKQVIARIDFGTPLPIANGPPRRVVDKLKPNFPRAELERVHERTFALLGAPTLLDPKEKPHWVYSGKDRKKKIGIMENFCTIEYVDASYDSFEVLESEFLSLVHSLFETFDNLQINRLGLRYVNKIDLKEDTDPTDWSKYLKPELLSLFELASDSTTLSRVFHLLEFNYGDTNLRFQSGMVNPDYPAPIRRKEFVLDYDCYCQLLLTESEIAEYLRVFHNRINDAFEEVITDDLRQTMEVDNVE